MEVTGTTHFYDLFAVPDLDAGRADLSIGISVPSHPSARSVCLHLRADGPDGGVHAMEEDLTLPAGAEPFSLEVENSLTIDDPQPWTVEDPQLYRLHAVLTEGERTLDAVSREFGMRTIDIDGIHIRLNGRPIYLIRSVGEPASGDVQRLPGDVVGLVTGQVDRHVGHVLGPLDASDRHRCHRLRLE